MDAATAAKDRVDRALALIERRLLDLKSRAAGSSDWRSWRAVRTSSHRRWNSSSAGSCG